MSNFIGYFKSRGTKLEDGYHAIPPVRSDICLPIFGSQLRNGNIQCFLYLISMENEQTRFIESSDGEIKELVANAVPENTKKSTKYAVNAFEGE